MCLPNGRVLLMYVDDLLLAAPTTSACLEATRLTLLKLHSLGFKASKKKLQCCRREVVSLGHLVSASGSSMSAEHRLAILKHKQPDTVKDMLAFLGPCGYSRHFLPCFAERAAPLRALVRAQGHSNLTTKLQWTDTLFVELVQDLSCAAALASPDYSLPFRLDAAVTLTIINATLYQKVEGRGNI